MDGVKSLTNPIGALSHQVCVHQHGGAGYVVDIRQTHIHLHCDQTPPAPRLLSSESSPQFGTPFCVISETFLQCSHCKSLWPCASGRRTASLRRSSHSTPNMKTYVVIKGLLIPRGTHSCETFLRRSSTAWWGVSGSLACCVLL